MGGISQYINMLEPTGDYIGEKPFLFYRDAVTMPISGTAAFSIMEVYRQDNTELIG